MFGILMLKCFKWILFYHYPCYFRR